ncbi:MAG: SPOR domain-containing protein [Desulfuromonadales bacterium]|jgi:cell division septation protein DedD|nr:SPOR domain-containing protein [Desulfuromonadales bacterium]
MERKQALTLLVLVLVVSLSSFTLGVIVGRRGAERDMTQSYPEPRRIMVAEVPQQPPLPVAEEEAKPAEEEKLTFYDNLSRGETVPLGSGINLPPEEKKAEEVKPQPKPAPQPPPAEEKAPEPPAPAKAPAVVEGMPTSIPPADAGGTYSVQVGAFSSVADAGRLKKSLIKKGYPVFIAEADLGPKGLWYRVRLGPYADPDTAKKALLIADQKDKIKGFVSRL